MTKTMGLIASIALLATFLGVADLSASAQSGGSGGSSSGGTAIKTDTIKVSKCYCNAGGEMLIKASSSDPTAHLYAYFPDGTFLGEVQNGGGGRYGGTVMPYVPFDPLLITIKSSSGGKITVPTTPFLI